MGRYYFGQIVEVFFNDGHGKTKPRPALVLSNDDECKNGWPLLFLMISTSPTEPQPFYHVKVHESSTRNPKTGLSRPCQAKCNVVRELEQRRVIRSLGFMPAGLLEFITKTYDELLDDDEFTDWQ